MRGMESWRPKSGSRVRLRPRQKDFDRPIPTGVWCVIDRAPGHMNWWVKATDLEAQAWASQHPGEIVSQCWIAHADQLDPVSGVRLF